ncbi:hypothetical protein ZHAS_00019205 [Anopheles sinensis]|uniref:Uncharacterized protein n=1 Tax=Anopheles sinensis TaxID=74873 RepID=A0A084WKT2_ANOSI|nr:hypothetical protein ZHAS_00019205 [Anopheles sinensis]
MSTDRESFQLNGFLIVLLMKIPFTDECYAPRSPELIHTLLPRAKEKESICQQKPPAKGSSGGSPFAGVVESTRLSDFKLSSGTPPSRGGAACAGGNGTEKGPGSARTPPLCPGGQSGNRVNV